MITIDNETRIAIGQHLLDTANAQGNVMLVKQANMEPTTLYRETIILLEKLGFECKQTRQNNKALYQIEAIDTMPLTPPQGESDLTGIGPWRWDDDRYCLIGESNFQDEGVYLRYSVLPIIDGSWAAYFNEEFIYRGGLGDAILRCTLHHINMKKQSNTVDGGDGNGAVATE